MISYIITSVHFVGAVQFDYKNGLLVFYSAVDADLTEKQLIGFLKKMPREEQDLEELRKSDYFTIKKQSEDLSFESFWEEYGKKIHPHRCEPFWRKCSDAKKLLYKKAIGPYKHYCSRSGVSQANPENYLKREYYKTDWSKE